MSKTANPLLNALIKTSGNKYASIADDGIVAGDIVSFIGTGSYVLNALISGSIFGGLPSNRITARDVADSRTVVVTQAALEKLEAALG